MNQEINGHNSHNGHSFPGVGNESEATFNFTDELDHEIVMHREAHFGGDFGVMFDYYMEDGIGVNPHFEIERIEYLAQIEKERGEDLAPLLLTGTEAERIAGTREAYRQLKEVYESNEPLPRLIADLILSEEEEFVEEIDAIIARGREIVPALIKIVRSDETYGTLFPGYGYAPYRAIICLGKIQDPEAIIPLFEALGRETVFGEEIIPHALSMIGEPAKQFLLKIIKSRPLTEDNVHSAFALTAFPNDEQVALAAFEQLQDPEVQDKPLLSVYLLCCCTGLEKTSYRDAFVAMAKDPSVPQELRSEIAKITADWK